MKELLQALRAHDVAFAIVGGVAATLHGSARATFDLDVVYARDSENLKRIVAALAPYEPYLRGAPPGLPFQFDASTLKRGLNFTLTTTAGAIDLFGELAGIGSYDAMRERCVDAVLYGASYRVIDLEGLILAKKAAGRPKDLETIAELEAIREERG